MSGSMIHVDKSTLSRRRWARLHIWTRSSSECRMGRVVVTPITSSCGMCPMMSNHNFSADSPGPTLLYTVINHFGESTHVVPLPLRASPTLIQKAKEVGKAESHSPLGDLPLRRTRSPMYGPTVCKRSDGEHLYGDRRRSSILSRSSNRFNNPKA